MEDSVFADSVPVAADASPLPSPAMVVAGTAEDEASSPGLFIENDDSMASSTTTPSADKLTGMDDDDPEPDATSVAELEPDSVPDEAAGDSVAAASSSEVTTVAILGSSTR